MDCRPWVAGYCASHGLFARTEEHPKIVSARPCWIRAGDDDRRDGSSEDDDEDDDWGGDENDWGGEGGGGKEAGPGRATTGGITKRRKDGGDGGGNDDWTRRVLLTVGIGADLMCLLLTPLRGGVVHLSLVHSPESNLDHLNRGTHALHTVSHWSVRGAFDTVDE